MTIISRFSRLLVGDMHAVLDRLEEPELVLRQSIREMEEALQAQHARLQCDGVRLRRLQRTAAEMAARLAELDEQLDASIGAGRMDTARSVVRRKLEAASLQELVHKQVQDLSEQLAELARVSAQGAAELEALREKAEIVCRRDECATHEAPVEQTRAWVDAQDVEAALLREIERRRGS